MFLLHAQLAKDCIQIAEFPLCKILLMNDANYPWYILVPKRANISEIFQLSSPDQHQLTSESVLFSQILMELYRPDKLNIAALGNIVPQLHVHHIARYRIDNAWPAPVWGKAAASEYSKDGLENCRHQFKEVFDKYSDFIS